jgi:hypothetical protein
VAGPAGRKLIQVKDGRKLRAPRTAKSAAVAVLLQQHY